MKKYYEITGMSCDDCVENVKKALMELPDVVEAEVKLKPQGVLLTLNESIDTNVLQAQIHKAGSYTILNSHGDGNGVNEDTPDIQRTHSFTDTHTERHEKPFGIDHEPGVI
ncbi:heavy-metal-associated domain-containing protein [Arcticibacter eurypsychrophilus]|uniref:heavy-metal-associated domain-containing protein n=1 Tax=Arcticibacter eurypsychrophilus TaxID=1434752 RepID=UPI00084D7A47|nr:heavy metal-associated domain-containing protein [Arcticibacter eurypsychrophilus]